MTSSVCPHVAAAMACALAVVAPCWGGCLPLSLRLTTWPAAGVRWLVTQA
ncbi:MAG: hypothetical protein OEU94_00095 [Aquincola sp.]|nr:hypothetical protein [Aquincola sp.]MDH5328410.1 hypothetical protein [Aquincola sp.]